MPPVKDPPCEGPPPPVCWSMPPRCGVDVTVEVVPDMVHAFPVLACAPWAKLSNRGETAFWCTFYVCFVPSSCVQFLSVY